jgi:hypothetical protein
MENKQIEKKWIRIAGCFYELVNGTIIINYPNVPNILQIQYIQSLRNFVHTWDKTKKDGTPRFQGSKNYYEKYNMKWFKDPKFAFIRAELLHWQAIQTTWYVKDYTTMQDFDAKCNKIIKNLGIGMHSYILDGFLEIGDKK